MNTSCTYIPYQQTQAFKQIVLDYIHQKKELQPFYKHPVSIEGIEAAIAERQKFGTNRQILVDVLKEQYQHISLHPIQEKNIQSLLQDNTFTITTAHQPNIFTGPLYFIYKIIHAIKIADELKTVYPKYHFVPFYYMGSEDADLDELGYFQIHGEKRVWNTQQTGAVGRIKVDAHFIQLIQSVESQIAVLPFGNELVQIFKDSYRLGIQIQEATLQLVNKLFAQFGLLVIIPDNTNLKKQFEPIVTKELIEQFSQAEVAKTIEALSTNYKVQASGRDINLFYLIDDKRERIEKIGNEFVVNSLRMSWSEAAILQELQQQPERFSANVILRGVFQETILPNIVFIGGGGEIAYWLELKKVFEAAKVPYPLLVLRNSFLLIEENDKKKIDKMELLVEDFFQPVEKISEKYVLKHTNNQLHLTKEINELNNIFTRIESITNVVDVTLTEHTKALQAKLLKPIIGLEKKIIRSEKRKYAYQLAQIQQIKNAIFPKNNLQERIENVAAIYAYLGKHFLEIIYHASPTFEQKFTIIEWKKSEH